MVCYSWSHSSPLSSVQRGERLYMYVTCKLQSQDLLTIWAAICFSFSFASSSFDLYTRCTEYMQRRHRNDDRNTTVDWLNKVFLFLPVWSAQLYVSVIGDMHWSFYIWFLQTGISALRQIHESFGRGKAELEKRNDSRGTICRHCSIPVEISVSDHVLRWSQYKWIR